MSQEVVAILTQPFDPHADPVIRELGRRGVPVVRLDTGDFPVGMQLSAQLEGDGWTASLRFSEDVGGRREVDLASVKSIWYRRPSWFRLPETMPSNQRSFARGEALAALGGVLRTLGCLWVSHPDQLAVAGYKPLQLVRARQCGLLTPETIVTNDPEAARDFYDEHGPDVIYKTIGLQQVTGPDGLEQIVYTTRVTDHLAHLGRVANTACCFQQIVKKRTELRITVIGERLFAVAIDSSGSAPGNSSTLDWRSQIHDASYSVFDLPGEVESQCRRLVQDFGLSFGAIDMIVTPNDEYVFLEINANGQWMWLEEATGLPMTEALIDLLVQ